MSVDLAMAPDTFHETVLRNAMQLSKQIKGKTADRRQPVVIVATKGRADEAAVLVDLLLDQSLVPQIILLVGTSPADLPNQRSRSTRDCTIEAIISPKAGLTLQRNFGLAWVHDRMDLSTDMSFIAFFDDDFRPERNWLEACRTKLDQDNEIVGVTGWVIADGINGAGYTETDARAFLQGTRQATPHWTDRPDGSVLESAYGCNMAFRYSVFSSCRFDDDMPLYGWQEDTDFTGQTRRFGKTVIARDCRGVHLGVKSSRTSGVRLGYSQIANPLRIAARGNMRKGRAVRFVLRAVAANTLKSFTHAKSIDYPGRLKGNLIAFKDVAFGRCHPQRILDFT